MRMASKVEWSGAQGGEIPRARMQGPPGGRPCPKIAAPFDGPRRTDTANHAVATRPSLGQCLTFALPRPLALVDPGRGEGGHLKTRRPSWPAAHRGSLWIVGRWQTFPRHNRGNVRVLVAVNLIDVTGDGWPPSDASMSKSAGRPGAFLNGPRVGESSWGTWMVVSGRSSIQFGGPTGRPRGLGHANFLTTLFGPQAWRRIVTWLILPVVICLSQRLSHACLSISNYTVKLRMAH